MDTLTLPLQKHTLHKSTLFVDALVPFWVKLSCEWFYEQFIEYIEIILQSDISETLISLAIKVLEGRSKELRGKHHCFHISGQKHYFLI